jgi:hypothetical protein
MLEKNYPEVPIDIVLLTCNRVDNSRKTIEDLYDRVRCPDKVNGCR